MDELFALLKPLSMLLGFAAILGVFYYVWREGIRARTSLFENLAARFENGSASVEENLSKATGGTYRATGELGGRSVSVELAPSTNRGDAGRVTYAVDVPEAKFWFGLTSAGVMTQLKRKLGLGDAGASPGDRFVLKSANPKRVARLLAEDHVTEDLARLLDGFDELRLSRGQLYVSRESKVRSDMVEEGAAIQTLQRLVRVANACLPVEAEVEITPRVLLTGLLCPFCRDDMNLAGDDVAPCTSCSTFHHAACLEEAGGCTIYGCDRASPRLPA